MQRELHPTLLSSLEGIVDQMVWFRENWHEEVRRTEVLVLVCVCLLVCVSGSDFVHLKAKHMQRRTGISDGSFHP